MGLRGNRGEWSEVYVLVYLLSTGKLYLADANLDRLSDDAFFSILAVYRKECARYIKYVLSNLDNEEKVVLISVDDVQMRQLTCHELVSEAKVLLNSISTSSSRNGAFSIPRAEDVLSLLECKTLRALSNDKTDISLKIKDCLSGYIQRCGFSIKSQLGNPPTLLNASKATNFQYQIKGMNDSLMDSINSIESRTKINDRMLAIHKSNAVLSFKCMKNATFSNNLLFIDSNMDRILSEMLITYYSTKSNKCRDVIERLERLNPLNFPSTGYYTFKFKKFLTSVALGMMPSTPWNGKEDANGGYIVVKQNGDVLAYHLYQRDFFEDFLLDSTKFDTPSSSRNQYMFVYKENDDYFIDLNLQIRFLN